MIVTIFGKKGSGKSVLSKNYMLSIGGKVIFFSPVESLNIEYEEIWDLSAIPEYMENQKPGNILLIRLADIESLDLVCAQSIINNNGYTLVIDEMDRYRHSTQLKEAIHYSRHFNINIIANTRRYVDMPRLLTSQADEICIFNSQEPRDLEYIRQFISKEASEKCKTLPLYNHLKYTPSNSSISIHKAKYQNI